MPENPFSARAKASLFDLPLTDLVGDGSVVGAGHQLAVTALFSAIEKVRTDLGALGVLSGLQAEQQMKVAAFVLDADSDYQYHRVRAAPDRVRALKRISKEGPGHIRTLVRILQRAKALLEGVAKRSRKLDAAFKDAVGAPIAQAIRDIELVRANLLARRKTITERTAEMSKWREGVTADDLRLKRWQQGVACWLVDFFHRTASPTLNDAHVKTARIGNALGWWTYTIEPRNSGEECAGIRMLLTRLELGMAPVRQPIVADSPTESRLSTPIAPKPLTKRRRTTRSPSGGSQKRSARPTKMSKISVTGWGRLASSTRSPRRTLKKKPR